MNAADIRLRIQESCRREGFAMAGVAPISALSRQHVLQDWVDQGKHGSMAYMAEQLPQRLDPSHILAGVKSAIVVADQYSPRGHDETAIPGHGRIARYARGRDYHDFMKKRLRRVIHELRPHVAEHRFRACVDTAPLCERELASLAGLGWIGKNTMLIHPERGSWLLLGVILTTMDIGEVINIPDYCGTCTRCIDACPTQAISDHSVDARRCISYLTIEHRHAVDTQFHQGIGDWILGCDVCQEVCPHNSDRGKGATQINWKAVAKPHTTAPLPGVWGTPPAPDAVVDPEAEIQPAYAPRRVSLPLLDTLGWSEADRREAFATSAMKRVTLEMMKRNVMIAATNQASRRADLSFIAALQVKLTAMVQDRAESELVRQTAENCLIRLSHENGAQTSGPAE